VRTLNLGILAHVDAGKTSLTELLPALERDASGPLSGTVFKVERGASGERVAYARLFSGTLHVRDRLPLRGGADLQVVGRQPQRGGGDVLQQVVGAARSGYREDVRSLLQRPRQPHLGGRHAVPARDVDQRRAVRDVDPPCRAGRAAAVRARRTCASSALAGAGR
jgi:hypothetical protein